MHKAIKENADSGDIKGLKYIFADCLDVDPTFEKYKEDYEYCQRKVPGLFEQHKDMTPLTENQKEWDYDYWRELKIDLVNNFSKKRFEHMIRVAKVIYAGKIKVISEKREIEYKEAQDIARQKTDNIINSNTGVYNRTNITKTKSKEEQEKEIREAKEKLARENSYIEEREKQQQQIRDMGSQRKISGQNIKNNEKEDDSLKKLIGVLLGIVIILVLVIVILSQ